MSDPMTRVLPTFRLRETTGFDDAWVGLEPTFQTKKSIRKWRKLSVDAAGEDAYFHDPYMLDVQKVVAKSIAKRYMAARAAHDPACMFASVERKTDTDQWSVSRRNLVFRWEDPSKDPFTVRLSLDPETFEYSVKPVPLAWFYDARFVRFLQEFIWRPPLDAGLSASIAHGGAQFSISAKTYLTGSLLADDIAYKLSHPELSCWIMDWPNPDDRAFRATRRRFSAFRRVLERYWAGGFHPGAVGVLTAENALFDRGFGPSEAPPPGLMDPRSGPVGDAREVFQTNFAFGRTVRLEAQSVHPGYWQGSHPKEDGYRPDQIMRYSEGNLNRLQISGEHHVKSGKVLHPDGVPELSAPLDPSMLTPEASWENRAQMSRTSAVDMVEALLLDVHHARYLAAHPHVTVRDTLLQDEILLDAEATLRRRAPATLDRLRREARALNLEASAGRIRSDWIEPEALLFAAWGALQKGERGAIAREAVASFVERVHDAASADPRPASRGKDPMDAHRHRIHPILWRALLDTMGDLGAGDPVAHELARFTAERDALLARRPVFSQADDAPPWEGLESL